MPSIVSSEFRVQNAATFVFGVSVAQSSIYMGIGKPTPWSAFGSTDSNPPTPNDDVSGKKTLWNSLLAMKRITGSDVRMAIKRYNWTANTIYTQYNCNDSDLLRKNFYVYTTDGNVYKCISNNNGALSTVKPTGTGVEYITTADGYVWKFMYTISANDAERFVTPHYIPVHNISNNVWTEANGGPTENSNPFAPDAYFPYSTGSDGVFVKGHGSSNIHELGGFYAIANAMFEYNEGGKITVTNDYRRVVLINGPRQNSNNLIASQTVYNMTTRINLSGQNGNFSADQVVTVVGGTTATVVDVGSGYITVTGNITDIPNSGTITSSSASATITSVVHPEIKKYSGAVLFVEQRTPIVRASDQVESLNIVLEF